MLLQKRLVLKISKTLISQKEIENKISEIADLINSKYKGEELVVVGILKGAFIVVSDLRSFFHDSHGRCFLHS